MLIFPGKLRYEVTEDECRHRRPEWAKTEIRYKTDKSDRLPIQDIAIRDIGEPEQLFYIQIGPVCFM